MDDNPRELSITIPKEIKSEIKLKKNIYLKDFFTMIGLIPITMIFMNFVHSSVMYYFYGLMAVIAITLLIRPKSNPDLRIYSAVYLALTRNRARYRAVDMNIGDAMLFEEEENGHFEG
ncbi:DUF5592 family protein [Listeria monocytogenes]|uniref:Uncharacterized protein n=4 Tax=Listeria TaxID=1637 RepID=D7V1F8_LISGR|nr:MULTISPECIES: DUF5592 family protein [Listeria]EAG6272416.1 hypothetical protein [Listeria monocytogenes CFSAN003726]EAG6284949.1 hypothetical protein [Listeria monocytogenes CFSAN003810]EAG6360538.1 hypothetical protein [Listeria monocytogenes CFSAN003729]EAG6369488.1 hypothetical protein [Listeria monocytogenes CFSAN003728]ECR3486990.1 hypothetical protein [Listeria innocua]MCX62522.1 hypothetical protein [Listeria monocytogenes serotype 4b]MCX98335.1 hypothetical protein [Listeria mono